MTIAHRLLLLLTLLFPGLNSTAQAAVGGFEDEEPLMPDEAFKLSTRVIDANTLRAEWAIADKYYLYRDKFKFVSDTEGITPGTPSFPKGKIKEDEFFGKVETYRHKVAVDIPLERSPGTGNSLTLKITSQGCADMGICYPPQTKTVTLALPPLASAEPAVSSTTSDAGKSAGFNPLGALKDLGNKLGLVDSSDDFLHPDQAFTFSVEAVDGNRLRAHWDIADNIYLYQDKFKFELKDAKGVTLGTPILPKGKKKVDESFGEMIVYYHNVDIDIPLTRTNLDPTEIVLVAKYQGCADAGFCYPPITKEMPVSLPAGAATAAAASSSDAGAADAPVSEQDRIADSLASGNTLLTIITFFGFGLLLAFTPCVFPMIPILSGIIVGQGESITARRAFIMSLVYVLAMALTYTAAGIAAGAFGQNLQAAFQNPWILASFAGVFVALSFSMFGFYDLQMPSFLQSRLTEVSNKQKGGTLTGVAIMGLLSALIVGPCVAAPLAGALIYIGQTGDMVLGGLALFALSLGMGAPLLAIGASAGKLLPKAGPWMDTIKAVFGVLMLAVAVWMLERIIPVAVAMLLWGSLMIVSAIYMGALDPVGENASGWRKLWKGLGVVLLIYGALQLAGTATGGKDTLQPLHGLAMMGGGGAGAAAGGATNIAHGNEMVFKRIKGLAELDREVAAASAAGKSVMVDFYADWCVSCKEMEKYTFSDPGVQQALANTVLLQADVTVQDEDDKALQKKFNIIGPPAILFFGTDGKERKAYRVVGFVKPGPFREHIEKALR
ncbi:MAG TPA: protein-disulfide reductase DsbD [Gammaproteobacteria bacterium]|nr:protein-disulfide reductase DsbD [Gammaproteobacteria bacterium]